MQAESGLCFFLLNDSQAEENWSEMRKLFSAFHELPNEVVIFVCVFPMSLVSPWKHDCCVCQPRLGIPPPHFNALR